MIKRTLYFGSPVYLSTRLEQLVIKLPEVEKNESLSDSFKASSTKTVPIEDVGIVVLDNSQITITQNLIEELLGNNVSIITCDRNKMPIGMMLPLSGNSLQSERFRHQIAASIPLKKQLWQQTIRAKILNQASILQQCRGEDAKNMQVWANKVKSGDPENLEARAAVFYWKTLFQNISGFTREREGIPPNNLLNYGYAILRATIARSLIATGLLPTLGIFHHNRYNAYCLADDIMEPYRPYVDKVIVEIVDSGIDISEMPIDLKKKLLVIPTLDVNIDGIRRPLMIATQQTASSLYKCFSGELRKIVYPENL